MKTAYLIKADDRYPIMICANQADAEETCLALTQEFTYLMYCDHWHCTYGKRLETIQKQHPNWLLWQQVDMAVRSQHRYYCEETTPLYTIEPIPFMEE